MSLAPRIAGRLAASVVLCAGLLGLAIGCSPVEDSDRPSLRIGFLGAPGSASEAALRGVRVGAMEADHTARLLGRRVELLVDSASSPPGAERAARRLLRSGAVAIVGGFDDETCRTLAATARREEILFLNIGCRAESLRDSTFTTTFHVQASESMYLATPAGGAGPPLTPVLWHAALERFGAAQLNERLARQGEASPDADTWAGWMAVKALWEGSVESGTTDPTALALHFRMGASFDGHKGEPLRFDAGTHQLLQPLFEGGATEARSGAARGGGAPSARMEGAPVPLTRAGYVFITNEGSADVAVIDPEAGRVVARIGVGARPRGIQVSPDARLLYVALSDDSPLDENDEDAIVVIDLARGEVTGRFRAGSDPEQFSLSPDGRYLYAANEDAGTASITDTGAGEVLATLVVGIEPEGIATSPDGRWVYVAAETSNTVSVIDTRLRDVVASFLVDSRPRGVAFSPTAPLAFVTNEISGTLSVIDTRTHRVLGSLPTNAEETAKPVGIAVSPDGSQLFVANGHANTVSVIDAETYRIVAEIPVGRRPWGIALSSDGSRAYTANGGSNDVSIIDARTHRVIATVAVGDRPWGVAVAP